MLFEAPITSRILRSDIIYLMIKVRVTVKHPNGARGEKGEPEAAAAK